MTASPPADQPADHIGEGKTFEQIKALIEADEAGRLSVCDLRTLLSLIARQQETIRADGEALEEIAADGQPYRSGYCQTDISVDPALTAEEAQSKARTRLSARQGGG